MVRIFVGNLPMDTLKDDIERLFRVFGSVLTVEVKRPAKPPAFAFVEMAEGSNAKDTIASLDGTDFQGSMLRVELSKASLPNNGFNRTRSRGGPRPGNYRLIVEGLPSECSWQDLKDHFRVAGDVAFTDMIGRGVGVVDYDYIDEMERAIDKLDRSRIYGRKIDVYELRSRSSSRSSRSSSRGSSVRSRSHSRSHRHRSHSHRPRRSHSRRPSRRTRSRSRSSRGNQSRHHRHRSRRRSHRPSHRDRSYSRSRSRSHFRHGRDRRQKTKRSPSFHRSEFRSASKSIPKESRSR
eukprot:TRINITY_DN1692_c0_g1_i3.p1 TRINITY_DN1692_c0_g1~~TRINITY_DN1692_c0_g1_i3.p1  ORF type:complete len:293 (-),score=42.54 TRINITY_DN1692_c0_g1_i3:328-1206(-)